MLFNISIKFSITLKITQGEFFNTNSLWKGPNDLRINASLKWLLRLFLKFFWWCHQKCCETLWKVMIIHTKFIFLGNNVFSKDCSQLKLTKSFHFLLSLVKPVLKMIFLQPLAEIRLESQKIAVCWTWI